MEYAWRDPSAIGVDGFHSVRDGYIGSGGFDDAVTNENGAVLHDARFGIGDNPAIGNRQRLRSGGSETGGENGCRNK